MWNGELGSVVHLVSRYIYQQLITLLVTMSVKSCVDNKHCVVLRCDITSINTLHTASMSRLLKCLAHQSSLTKLSYLANVVLLGIVIFLLLHRHKGDT